VGSCSDLLHLETAPGPQLSAFEFSKHSSVGPPMRMCSELVTRLGLGGQHRHASNLVHPDHAFNALLSPPPPWEKPTLLSPNPTWTALRSLGWKRCEVDGDSNQCFIISSMRSVSFTNTKWSNRQKALCHPSAYYLLPLLGTLYLRSRFGT